MKNDDFRGGAICRTLKGATACAEVLSSVPALRVQVSSCFALVFRGFHGVFMGFSRVLTVSAVSGASPQNQARRTSYPLRAAFSSPVLGTSTAPIHLAFVLKISKIWPGTIAWAYKKLTSARVQFSLLGILSSGLLSILIASLFPSPQSDPTAPTSPCEKKLIN